MEGRGKRGNTQKRSRKDGSSSSRAIPDVPRPTQFEPPINSFGIIFTKLSHAERFALLSHCRVKPTQFPSDVALQRLRIFDNILHLHTNLACARFLTLHEQTFEKLTLEFISTFNVFDRTEYDDWDRAYDEKYIRFRLFNQDHSLTFTQLNAILGWPSCREFDTALPRTYNEGIFWREITGLNSYEPRTAKSSSIIHPVFRIIHRMYVCTIFARRDKGTINRKELYLLWVFATSHEGINMAHLLMQHLYQFQVAPVPNELHFGGLITLIAKGMDIDIPEDLVPVAGSTSLDIQAMRNMKMITQRNNREFTWMVSPRNIEYSILPDPEMQIVHTNQPLTWTIPKTIDSDHEEEGDDEENPHEPDNQGNQGNQGNQDNPGYQGNPFPPNFFEQFNQMYTQVGHIYDYGTANWPGFPPPPPPPQ